MNGRTTAVRAWVGLLTGATVAATIAAGPPIGVAAMDWLALAIFAGCAAVAYLFPVRSGLGGASYRLTSVFAIAGAVVLPAPLVTPLAVLAISPERWLRRRRRGALIGWAFNIAQTALAGHAAHAALAGFGQPGADPGGVALMLAVAAVFTVVQELLVGVVIALQAGIPLTRADNFTRAALLSNGLLSLLGVVVAGLWLVGPALLLLLLPLLVIAHQLTRTAQLAHLAQVDVKTGLHNFRHFEQVLDEELERGRRVGRPLAVLFADLDRFKQVNDRYGHAAGDQVLHELAGVLTAALRKGDLVARFGGEEFVALLPGTDAEEAVRIAERVRSAVEEHAFVLGDGTLLHCTVSIGVAVCPEDGTDAATLLGRADAALYRAKVPRNTVARAEAPQVAGRESVVAPPSAPAAQSRPSHLAAWLLWGTVVIGCVMVGRSLVLVTSAGVWPSLLPLLVVAICAELLHVQVYDNERQKVTLSFTPVVAMATLTALAVGAPLVYVVASSAHLVLRRPRQLDKALFNLANPAVAAALASIAYLLLRPSTDEFSGWHLVAALVAALVFQVANVGGLALTMALYLHRPVLSVARELGWYSPTQIFLGLTGAFIGGAYQQLGVLGTAMFVVPVLLLRFTLGLYAGTSQRIIERLQVLNRQLEHQALHDGLTGLPNRTLLHNRLQSSIQSTRVDGQPFGLVVLDLDRFQEINDTFGHLYGDRLLQQVGPRLQAALRASDTLARLGGDEFGALVPASGVAAAPEVAQALQRALEQPFLIEGHSLSLGASMGIAVYPDHADTTLGDDANEADALLRRADVALYVAKRTRSGHAVYASEQDQYSPERLALISELRRAIEHDELRLLYQPKVGLGGRCTSVEALVRWQHPRLGLLPPDQFIPLAEQTGLILPLGRWVLDTALRQCRTWQLAGLDLSIAVNLSVRNLHDPGLSTLIPELLAARAVDPAHLIVEITESTLMLDPGRALAVLASLRRLGVRVAVDDFGTGYSSLAYLTRLPIDELKIDRSFVRYMSADEKHAAIVRSTIALGHDLGLVVVAEGAEDEATWNLLGELGCDLVQGYVISRPQPAIELARWVREWSADQPVRRLAA